MNWRPFAVAFIGAVIGIEAHAYELGTHARLTQKAYEQSVLGNSQIASLLFKDLGIELKDNPFSDRYYQIKGSESLKSSPPQEKINGLRKSSILPRKRDHAPTTSLGVTR